MPKNCFWAGRESAYGNWRSLCIALCKGVINYSRRQLKSDVNMMLALLELFNLKLKVLIISRIYIASVTNVVEWADK